MILIILLFFKAILAKNDRLSAKKLVSDGLFNEMDAKFLKNLRFNASCDSFSVEAAAECELEFKTFYF